MHVYELINPSDPYTFEAPNIEVAGAAVCLLSTGFGAKRLSGEVDESTPVLFGWEEWFKSHGIDSTWLNEHGAAVADALDSFLIGDAATRSDTMDMLAQLSEDKRDAWRSRRQDRHRSSMNDIGEAAYAMAKRLRATVAP